MTILINDTCGSGPHDIVSPENVVVTLYMWAVLLNKNVLLFKLCIFQELLSNR